MTRYVQTPQEVANHLAYFQIENADFGVLSYRSCQNRPIFEKGTPQGMAAYSTTKLNPVLRVLLVEDSEKDMELILRTIRHAGYELAATRVDTAHDFDAALSRETWDLIVSDHSLPQFSSTAALASLQQHQLDLPFLVVSGTIDEETAVAILKAGAHDFITKQNLARLGPAVTRELQEARNRAERRQAQRDLREQRDFLRLVIDTNPSLIFVKDWDGTFILANRAVAEIYGTTVGELIGKTDADFNPKAEEVERFLRDDRETMTSRQAKVIPDELVTDARTGNARWFETRKVPLILPDGTSRQVLGIAMDITERRLAEQARREAEEQFRHAQKMEAVGQLAGGIAHDFNNLLTAILGYSELVLDRVRDQPDLAADVEEVRKAGERAGKLTRQLLAFSRKQVLEPQILDLNRVVIDVEKMLQRVIGEDVRLETISAPAVGRVKADPGQIEQVLMNLAVNARDAMPRGGTLTIQTANSQPPSELLGRQGPSRPDGYVSLTIRDTGCGMSPDVRARIFEPFFTTKGPGKGTGLGLSTVYGIVTQSGGSITVDSERDVGTTFTIYLPAVKDAVEPIKSTRPVLKAHGGTETILLVEDETAIGDLVCKVLKRDGYTVLEASNAADAITLSEHHPGPIHLLLTDIVMPGLNGPDLAQHIVAHRPRIRVLYISGFVSRLAIEFGSMGSAASFLHKPFTPEDLARKVRECLSLDVVQPEAQS